jgi:hypothetical protein
MNVMDQGSMVRIGLDEPAPASALMGEETARWYETYTHGQLLAVPAPDVESAGRAGSRSSIGIRERSPRGRSIPFQSLRP